MWESLLPFFEWNEAAPWGKAISATVWMFPVIETIHILALTVMYGAMTIIDLRLLGLGMRRQPVTLLTKNLQPYMTWGLITMLVTGYLLFCSEAMKCFNNSMYWYKMAFFFPATIFHFTLYRKVTRSATSGPAIRGLTGILALFLWFGVAVFGRAIGYF